MNKLIAAAAFAAAGVVFAQDAAQGDAQKPETGAQETAVVEKADDPLFNVFFCYGVYSGYQLYGSLVNSEMTAQGYAEINFNLNVADVNLGYLGVGVWSNTDLTDKRRDSYGKAFNEWDPNVHWGKTFWFDDDMQYGLDYRATVVWFYYPHRRHHRINQPWGGRRSTSTTMDFDHSFQFFNPFVVPFLDVVHEYHENNSDLLQFGLKRTFAFCEGSFTLTPSVTFVYRDHRYNWCFPTAGFTEFHNGGIATMKWQLDATYSITENFGLFAKVAFCSIIDKDLRDAAEHGSGADYSQYKDFVWGGIGFNLFF